MYIICGYVNYVLMLSMHGSRYGFARLKMFKSNGFFLRGRKEETRK